MPSINSNKTHLNHALVDYGREFQRLRVNNGQEVKHETKEKKKKSKIEKLSGSSSTKKLNETVNYHI
jgi:hypothetical protein